MELKNLVSKITPYATVNMLDGLIISGIEYDSRVVKKNQVFFSIKGENHDGNLFILEAVDNGAIAIVVSEFFYSMVKDAKNQDYLKIYNELNDRKIPILVVKDVVQAVSTVAAFYYDYPSSKLSLIGITGTNGKTSVSFILESILKASGLKPGIVGTILYRYADKEIKNIEYTTPKSLYLQRITDEMLKENTSHIVMEVSSHGVDMGRVSDLDFELCIFTNLSRDHMDYHKTMDNYFNAKKKLFTEILPKSRAKNKTALINVDCEYGRKLVGYVTLLKDIKLYTYGCSEDADIKIKDYELSDKGSNFSIEIEGKNLSFTLPLIGVHNVMNAVAAIASAIKVYDIPCEKISQALTNESVIPGRLERVLSGFNVFVDYAHTDDALSNVLISLRNSFPNKRVITVFGCGGDRDKGKRPKMGKVVSDFSDYSIVTSDNPRFEDPLNIIDSIIAGMRPKSYEVVPCRDEAIKKAIQIMDREKDVILIAGKGHEKYQIINDTIREFDDKELAKTFLQQYIQ